MSLETLRKGLKDKSEAHKLLIEKATAPESSAADIDALNASTAELENLQKSFDAVEKAEAAAARAAQPVKTPVKAEPTVKQHAVDDTAGFTLGVIMGGMAMVKSGSAPNLREALESTGFTAIADSFENLSGKQLASITATGNLLVPPTMASEIIEFLRPSTTFLQASPRRVPLENGSYFQSGGSTGATASYGRENSVPAYSEATFRDINLFAKELQGKTAISNLLLKRGVSGVRSFVDQDLRSAMAEAMDLNMFLGDGLQNRPLGVYNVPGISTRAAQDAVAPTAAQIDADARWAINALININLAQAKWVMSQETAGFLEDVRDANGNPMYPSMGLANPTFKKIPVLVTTNLPTNLGAGSNRSHISLTAYNHVLLGEEDGITVRVSDNATYTDAGGNLRSAFERDETVMIAVARHDVGVRHLRSVALLTDVRWGR
jgi:HK97 family phage major capsid protein